MEGRPPLTASVDDLLGELAAAFAATADPARATAMAKYMKNRFEFFGIPAPARRSIQRDVFGRWVPTQLQLVAVGNACWARPEREFHYAVCDLIARHIDRCDPSMLRDLERWITHRSWWDTVDALAHPVGDLVANHPELVDVMDRWIDAEDFWLARVSILYQLRYKTETDADRLFRYCRTRAGDREFFIRKAIGWALREYSKTDPAAVIEFVAAHEAELSPLSRREALRRIPATPTGSADARRSTRRRRVAKRVGPESP